jgi:hypothetical protein
MAVWLSKRGSTMRADDVGQNGGHVLSKTLEIKDLNVIIIKLPDSYCRFPTDGGDGQAVVGRAWQRADGFSSKPL